ncbi:MAG TPA: hypothetical protein VGI79_12425, partial [Caulobacteraceae bacterium]
MEPAHPIFGCFRARSENGTAYEVEIRSLDGFTNTCGCIDHRVNGLGTCKHIEGVLTGLRRRGARAFRQAAAQGSQRVEIFLRRDGAPTPILSWPGVESEETAAVRDWLTPHLDSRQLPSAEPAGIEALIGAYAAAPPTVRQRLRLSRHFGPWLERQRRERSRLEARAAF